MPNRLQHESSPYLRQHADQPVDWYPWGEEAFAAAHEQDKPILLSVGYAACHWCHVMARESFSDPQIAAFLNEHFVCIKVDREERPDVDDIYMQATLILSRSGGGWPMTVFLTPEGHPFHAGTYFPPVPRYGMPGFRQVLEMVVDAFQNRRDEVEQAARALSADLGQSLFLPPAPTPNLLNADLLDAAAQTLLTAADPVHGGLTRGRPKFPSPVNLEYLLRYHEATAEPQTLEVARLTLRKMAEGGLYDQIGGGFHRYSVDEKWLVPHFEKMLYDNAQLARVYLHAWQLTNEPLFRRVVEDTLDYLLREMAAPEGGFYSTQDADANGVEGGFYTWEERELRAALDGVVQKPDAVLAYWGVSLAGHVDGRNVLHVADMLERVAVRHGLSVEQMHQDIAAAQTVLFTLRKARAPLARDEKVLAVWNGMALAAFAEAARALAADDYRQAAERCAQFLLREMQDEEGRLWHTWQDGAPKIAGYLADYAHVIDGLLELYQTTFEPRWYTEAERLADRVLAEFAAEDGGFYDTTEQHGNLIVRPRNLHDSATPSANALMAYDLLRLTAFSAETRFEEAALALYQQVSGALIEFAASLGMVLIGVDWLVRRPQEIAIIGPLEDERTQALLDTVRKSWRPRAVVAHSADEADAHAVPALVRARAPVEGAPTAYVCKNFVCAAPVTEPEALAALLDAPRAENGKSVVTP